MKMKNSVAVKSSEEGDFGFLEDRGLGCWKRGSEKEKIEEARKRRSVLAFHFPARLALHIFTAVHFNLKRNGPSSHTLRRPLSLCRQLSPPPVTSTPTSSGTLVMAFFSFGIRCSLFPFYRLFAILASGFWHPLFFHPVDIRPRAANIWGHQDFISSYRYMKSDPPNFTSSSRRHHRSARRV